MNLHDPLFMTPSGESITGKQPTAVEVERALSGTQADQVEHVYKLFCDAARLSLVEYFVQHYKFDDGTIVTITRNQKQDFVEVANAANGAGEYKLPHGFLVEGSWIDPQILGLPDSNGDVPVLIDPPQAAAGIYGTHQLYYFDGTPEKGNFRAVQVVAAGSSRVWDMAEHEAVTSASSPKPLPLRIAGSDEVDIWHKPHFSNGRVIVDSDGTTVYTATDPWNPSIDENPLITFPAAADVRGQHAVLQAAKRAVLGSTSPITWFVFRNERVTRTAEAAYVASDTHIVDFILPHNMGAITNDISAGNLGEAVSDVLNCYYIQWGPNEFGGSRQYGTYTCVVNWPYRVWSNIGADGLNHVYYVNARVATQINPIDIGAGGMTGLAVRAEKHDAAAAPEYKNNLLALVGATSYDYVRWANQMSYPATEKVRAGTEDWSIGWDPLNYGGPGFMVHRNTIDRRQIERSTHTEVYSRFETPWITIDMVEGTVNTDASLRKYEDIQQRRFSSIAWANSLYSSPNIAGTLTPQPPLPVIFTTDDRGIVTEWIIPLGTETIVHDEWTSAITDGDMNPRFRTMEAEYNANPHITNQIDIPLTNAVNYSYTSKYVIDYDHKGQFCAMIRVEVTCTGATWGEMASPPWRGASEEKAKPQYTAKIYFEANWKGTTIERLLIEGSCTRPCFEATKLRYFNVYYWPSAFCYDPAHAILIREAPRITIPEQAFEQLYNIAQTQETSDNLVCEDVDTSGTFSSLGVASTESFDFSSFDGYGNETPQDRYRPGMLYARTFKLKELSNALWLLFSLKMNCTEDDIPQPVDDAGGPILPLRPNWFYMPQFGADIDEKVFNLQIKDGQFVNWTDHLVGKTDTNVWPNAPKPRPTDPQTWNLKLSRI